MMTGLIIFNVLYVDFASKAKDTQGHIILKNIMSSALIVGVT